VNSKNRYRLASPKLKRDVAPSTADVFSFECRQDSGVDEPAVLA